MKININLALSLEERFFEDQLQNIDYLVDRGFHLQAAELCEKFHSYFHFESAYFYYHYALELEKQEKMEEAVKNYRNCIFQSHLCSGAHINLINLLQKLGQKKEQEEAISYAQLFSIDLNTPKIPERPFKKFSNYIKFATSNKNIQDFTPPKNSFWLYHPLEEVIEKIKIAHDLYHKQAAIIYYNCGIYFKEKGDEAMASNAFIKSQNLFPNVKTSI